MYWIAVLIVIIIATGNLDVLLALGKILSLLMTIASGILFVGVTIDIIGGDFEFGNFICLFVALVSLVFFGYSFLSF